MDENKITIAVCGESHCAASTVDLKETGLRGHFSQILEDQYGYKVLHFAHGGFSNTGILFQIQEAVKHQPDVIVYNKTWASRITIKLKDGFRPDDGLRNFVYFNPHMPSTHEPWAGTLNASILSTVPQGLENHSIVSPEKLHATKQYLTELFDYDMQQILDNWLFEYWHDKILAAGILPLKFTDDDIGKVALDFGEFNPTFDSPFHTDRATQEQVAANIHCKIVDKLLHTK
jgi:hypothetical protein